MIISGVGDGVMQAANEEVFENKRFDAIAKYFDYFSTGRLNFCQIGQPKIKISLNWWKPLGFLKYSYIPR